MLMYMVNFEKQSCGILGRDFKVGKEYEYRVYDNGMRFEKEIKCARIFVFGSF